MKKIFRILAVTLVLSLWAVPGAQAITVTLSDANSSAAIVADSQAGMNSWIVDGVSMLYQQWFWYRIGDTGGEKSIDTISAPAITTPTSSLAKLRYSNGDIAVQIQYLMTGASNGSHRSDIAETILISNPGPAKTIHFFQYSDFDLGGPANDTVKIFNKFRADQSDPQYALSETVMTPPADHVEANFYRNTLNSLNDANPTTLSDAMGPFTGDTTWAFEWDIVLGAGDSFLISKDKQIRPVPEPGMLLLLGAGLVGLGILRKKI